MNLQQKYMRQALKDVRKTQEQNQEIQDAYRSLCHQIPMLVLTNGLERTAAFVDAKSKGESDRAKAFALTQRHMMHALGGCDTDTTVSSVLNQAEHKEASMMDTLTILDAWVYYKRFAVSLLDEAPATDPVRPDQPSDDSPARDANDSAAGVPGEG